MTKLKTLLPSPSRLAAYLTALAGLAGAVAVPVANLDLSSTVGVASGVGAIAAAYTTWAKGWRAHEQAIRTDSLDMLGERVPGAAVARVKIPAPPEPQKYVGSSGTKNAVQVPSPVREAPDPESGPQTQALVEVPDPEAARAAGIPTVFVPLVSLTQVVQSPTSAGPRAVSQS